jgi:hypothetical protein
MPTLGDLLAAARRSSGAIEAWLLTQDPATATHVRQAAAEDGLSTSVFVRVAIADFARFAPEEEWANLTSRLRDSDDPGLACLVAMLRWRMAATMPASPSKGPNDERQT